MEELLREAAGLPATTIEAADFPRMCSRSSNQRLLDLTGTYGDPNAGDPIQDDALRIEHDQGDVEIVVYNRAIPLFMTDSEAVRRIHRMCCCLGRLGGARTGVETSR